MIKRSILNARIRDFYDVYMLMHFCKNNLSYQTLKDAIYETAKHRDTLEFINNKKIVEEVIESLKNDDSMIKQWRKYQKIYEYAKDIEFISLIESIEKIKKLFNFITSI